MREASTYQAVNATLSDSMGFCLCPSNQEDITHELLILWGNKVKTWPL